ncbi:hypothetical protein Tdes44962_MAKER08817 [Teratosphaeria destructans]|uniref:Uncharacterized protein n=1 Tax=Teratosphaeria destructans TaxID=418781 RepID=A0A9W7W3X7_9PEZI|nr:hypothetical protein Tdes44962_MAKER08817 [Teratosphaeria destructans]
MTGSPLAPVDNTSVPIQPQLSTSASTLTTAPSGSVIIVTDITTEYTTSCPASTAYSTDGTTMTSTFPTVSQVTTTFQSTITVPAAATGTNATLADAVTGVPAVTLAPEYSSALSELTLGVPSSVLTSIVPSASVNPLVSSYIANLTAVLPIQAQPTGAVPTAIPTAFGNGTLTSPYAGDRDGGLSVAEIFAWIRYIVAETFRSAPGRVDGDVGGSGSLSYGGKSKRAHARDVRAGN